MPFETDGMAVDSSSDIILTTIVTDNSFSAISDTSNAPPNCCDVASDICISTTGTALISQALILTAYSNNFQFHW